MELRWPGPPLGRWLTASRMTSDRRTREFDRSLTARDRLDPERRFANGYLDRVLGP